MCVCVCSHPVAATLSSYTGRRPHNKICRGRCFNVNTFVVRIAQKQEFVKSLSTSSRSGNFISQFQDEHPSTCCYLFLGLRMGHVS